MSMLLTSALSFGGRPTIVSAFEQIIKYIQQFPGVWFTRHSELGRWALEGGHRRAYLCRSLLRKVERPRQTRRQERPNRARNCKNVLSGEGRISVPSPEGHKLLLAILFPGDVFGEIALLEGEDNRRRNRDQRWNDRRAKTLLDNLTGAPQKRRRHLQAQRACSP